MRFITPVLFVAAAIWVSWYNGLHADRVLVLPFVDVLDPSAAGNPQRMGELTVVTLGGIAVILAAWDTFQWIRARRDA